MKKTILFFMSIILMTTFVVAAPAKKPAPKPAPAPAAKPCGPGDDLYNYHDCCLNDGQGCTCSNTGWQGSCHTGGAKYGLYCHCD